MPRKYGRIAHPPLPAHMMLSRTAVNLPPVVDLRPWVVGIKDQGDEGSCTAHAGVSAREWITKKYFGQSVVLSPQYLYAFELKAQGDFPHDEGSDGETCCEQIIAQGICPIELYPYVAGEILYPTPEQIAAARPYKLGAYHGLQGSQTAQSVLGDPTPWPILVGFTVYESFESDSVAATGVYCPKPSEKVLGGHETLCVGCDLGLTPTLRPPSAGPSFLIQNSYGTSWGWEHGFFWMDRSVFDAPDTDLKIVHSGHPWK